MKKKLTKKQKAKKEQAEKKALFEKKVEALREKYRESLDKFALKHKTYLFCFPYGIKYNSKRELKSTAIQQHIYICKTLCEKQCDYFTRRTFLCKDLGCTYYPVCISKSKDAALKLCKKKGLLKERKKLATLYSKYFHAYAVYRSLRIDALRTLRYLKQQKRRYLLQLQ